MTFLKRIVTACAVVLFFAPTTGLVLDANAQEGLKVGFANAELVLQFVPEYKTIGEKVQRQLQSSQELLQSKTDEFQTDVASFEKTASLLPEDKQKERADQLQSRYLALQQLQSQKENEIAQFENNLITPLIEKVQKAVDEVAAEKGLDIVLKPGGILYINEEKILDITSDVAARLGVDLEAALANAGS